MKTAYELDLESAEFEQIVVNGDREALSTDSREKNKHEEVTEMIDEQIYDPVVLNSQQSSTILSIKDVTKGKNEAEITKMIELELGIEQDDATIWNKMVKAISQINISKSILF